MIAAGADVNIVNHKHSTPLHFYCYSNHDIQILRLLINAQANLTIPDERGLTPLLVCCTSGRNDLINVLVEHGVSVNDKDGAGRSAYDIAIFHQHKEIAARFALKH